MRRHGRRSILRRWTHEEEKLLGTDTDENIARRLGRTVDSVGGHRSSLGIPPKIEPAWTPEEEAMLGKFPDKALAARFGVCRSAIHWRRKKLGIPALPNPDHRPLD